MVADLGMQSRSVEGSALVCAAATYFKHSGSVQLQADEDRKHEASKKAFETLEHLAWERAVSLMEDKVEGSRITSEMLFAPPDILDELMKAEKVATHRVQKVSRCCKWFTTALLTCGWSLFWWKPVPATEEPVSPVPVRAADRISGTIERRPRYQ